MLKIKLGQRKYVVGERLEDPWLPRVFSGWDPAMEEGDVYDAARGWWRLAERAEKEKYALVVANGPDGLLARMAIEIKEWKTMGDRRAFAGEILRPGNAFHDAYVGKEDPARSSSRFPVLYVSTPFDWPAACRCGCGEAPVNGEWAQGHELRGLRDVIVRDFPAADFPAAVSVFLNWYESEDDD
ncbi:hypothetical protein AB0I28_32500 [Phytomonospora sp. NPDC050363]|uniref:hypothetical protein n=1 Tax=Phytomonospora sp. NPDC050363 TaxID=3155642 RepID=UPI0033FA5CC7